MSSVQYLTSFVNERLTAAVEEILGVFKKCIVEYEEEIDRQRRLLDIVWKPEIKLHRIELLQQHVGKEEEEEEVVVVVLPEQQLCNMERNSNMDQEDPEPPQIKEEQEELTPTCEKSGISEDQTLPLNPGETLSATEKEPVVNTVHSPVVSEPNSDHQLLSPNSNAAESQDHTRDNHGNSMYDLCNSTMLKVHLNAHTGKKLFKCETCGKAFKKKYNLENHMRTHTGEKPYICNTCGKRFRQRSDLKRHLRTHTGEKPHFCKICGKAYRWYSNLTLHMRAHTGEKPYICNTCGKGFCQISDLKRHLRTHTGEKPYTCKTCERPFKCSGQLTKHMKTHTV